jgi:hypothetical protein
MRATSRAILERFLEGGRHADDRTVPENDGRRFPPVHMWRKENGSIPVESPVEAAIGLWLSPVFRCHPAKLFCDEMLRVPELPGALVRDSGERTVDGRTQVRRKHRLPHH